MKKSLLFLTAILFLIPAVNQAQSTLQSATTDEEKKFTHVEQMPVYPGGQEAMMKFIAEHLKYPESAKKDKVEGMVLVQFTVTKTGAVQDVKVLRPLQTDCDAEAARVISSMPNWLPGQQDNKPVSVTLNLPIQSELSE
jgi:TonB family protein